MKYCLLFFITCTIHSLVAINPYEIPLTASVSSLSWTKVTASAAAITGMACLIHALYNMHHTYTQTALYQSNISFKKFVQLTLKEQKSIMYQTQNQEKEYFFQLADHITIRQNCHKTVGGGITTLISVLIIVIEELNHSKLD